MYRIHLIAISISPGYDWVEERVIVLRQSIQMWHTRTFCPRGRSGARSYFIKFCENNQVLHPFPFQTMQYFASRLISHHICNFFFNRSHAASCISSIQIKLLEQILAVRNKSIISKYLNKSWWSYLVGEIYTREIREIFSVWFFAGKGFLSTDTFQNSLVLCIWNPVLYTSWKMPLITKRTWKVALMPMHRTWWNNMLDTGGREISIQEIIWIGSNVQSYSL